MIDTGRSAQQTESSDGNPHYTRSSVADDPTAALQVNEGGRPGRRLPVGAECTASGVHFRVWAPRAATVDAIVERAGGRSSEAVVALQPLQDGYFERVAEGIRAGARYRFRLDGGEAYPDPASRFQPQGPHGPSEVVDPEAFPWTDARWTGRDLRGAVIYEMHIGTFTRPGTWAAAGLELEGLAELGITVIEVMPVAEFPGRFGWGYDGVALFAPTRNYGTPDEFRAFVDRAHALGLAVLLDVVYNHLGPDGNYLPRYGDYFAEEHKNEWGDGWNYDGPGSAGVREFVIANARYWITEFHLDGLRLDATQSIHDRSAEHIVAALTREVRQAAFGRRTIVVAENEPQDTRLARPAAAGGFGIDALWNDDYHHSAIVALTGRREAYFTDFLGAPQEFVSAAKWGYLFQGQRYVWQSRDRGRPSFGLPPASFVTFLDNHDQVANTGQGLRSHQLSSPGRYRALAALTLLGPGTPMLFQGQEFSATSPFLYFADHEPTLAEQVRLGRAQFMSQFPSLREAALEGRLPDPCAPDTFERCKLDLAERERHPESLRFHRDLLALRRTDPVFRLQGAGGLDGAVLGSHAFVLRFFGAIPAPSGLSIPMTPVAGEDRLLIVNLGPALTLSPVPEPLVAPPAGACWEILWSSQDTAYGGPGRAPLIIDDAWRLPGEAALVLAPRPTRDV
jgi:maltooligosyltrehalose trehalohydrolase